MPLFGKKTRRQARKTARSLSEDWRRQADVMRRAAVRAGHHAEHSMAGWWARLVPKVVQVEHRAGDRVVALGKRMRKARA